MAHEGRRWPTECSSRNSTRVRRPPVRDRRTSGWSVDLPESLLGMRTTVRPKKCRRSRESAAYGRAEPRVSTIRPSATNSTKPNSRGVYASRMVAASSGDGGTWSAYQAIKHIYYGPDWKKDVISPNWRFIATSQGRTRELYVDNAGLRRFRSYQLPRRFRPVVGRRTRQYRRPEQVLGLDGNLHPVGRLGRLLRSRWRRSTRSRQLGFRVPLVIMSPMSSAIACRTSSTKRPAYCVSPRISTGSTGSPWPTGARRRPQVTALTSRKHPPNSSRSRRPSHRSFSCVSSAATIISRPTTNNKRLREAQQTVPLMARPFAYH